MFVLVFIVKSQIKVGKDNVEPQLIVAVVSSELTPYLNTTGWAVPHGRVFASQYENNVNLVESYGFDGGEDWSR